MLFSIGNFILLFIFICIFWGHNEWKKVCGDTKLEKFIILISILMFVIILAGHYYECEEMEKEYEKDPDKWIKQYSKNPYININNKAFLLLEEFLKHPLVNGSLHAI